MTSEEQALFDQMIIEDGRHKLLFEQWQEGKITEEAFKQVDHCKRGTITWQILTPAG